MDEAEVDRLRKEAEKYADQDKERKEQVLVRNELDSMVYQCEKQLSDLGDKAPEEFKNKWMICCQILRRSSKKRFYAWTNLRTLRIPCKSFEELGQEAMKNAGAGLTQCLAGSADRALKDDDSASADDSRKERR